MEMNRVEYENQLVEILSNEELAEKIKEAKSLENIQAVLNEGGLALSLDETASLLAGVRDGMNQPLENELTEDELEYVNGGFSLVAAGAIGATCWFFANAAVGFIQADEKNQSRKCPVANIGYQIGRIFGKWVREQVFN